MPAPELQSPIPMPEPGLYQRHYSEYERTSVRALNSYNRSVGAPSVEWDAWVDNIRHAVLRGESTESQHKSRLLWRYRTLSQLSDALALPAIDNTHARVQHAFANGYLHQQRITEQMLGEPFDFASVFDPVADALNTGQQQFDTTEKMHEAVRERVARIGSAGLMATGHARGFLEKWSQEVFPDASDGSHHVFRDIYKMGHGVAIYGARVTLDRANSAALATLEVKSNNLEE